MCDVDEVCGVTHLHDIVYVICYHSTTMRRYNSTTRQRLTDIKCKDMKHPVAITVCQQTSHIYLADSDFDGFDAGSIWLVSAVGGDIKHWLPKSPDSTFRPRSLSVTSTRLLVTLFNTNWLIWYDADGNELTRVQFPDYIEPYEATESPTGTFISSSWNAQLRQFQLTEFNIAGQLMRQFGDSFPLPLDILVDSPGNVLVADPHSQHILLHDNHLSLRRVIVDEIQLNHKQPHCMHYMEQSGQLLVGLKDGIVVFDVLRR